MKKKVKKYLDFVNEELDISILNDNKFEIMRKGLVGQNLITKLLILRSEFLYELISTINEHDKSAYYSQLCKTNSDPYEDYSEIQRDMDAVGWTFGSIRNLFSKEVNEMCGYDIYDFIQGRLEHRRLFDLNLENISDTRKRNQAMDPFEYTNSLTSKDGYCDIYLYKTLERLGLDKNKVDLGGNGWSDLIVYDKKECLIRYRYGYHHTKYGQLMLDQVGMSESKFIEKSLDGIIVEIIDELDYRARNNRTAYDNIMNHMNLEKFMISEEDRVIIYVKDIVKYIEKAGLSVTIDKVKDQFINIMSGVCNKLKPELIGGDLVFQEKNDN